MLNPFIPYPVFFSAPLKCLGEVKQNINAQKSRWGTPQHVHKAEAAEAFRYSALKLLATGSLRQATNKAEPVAVAETAAETPEQKEVSLDSAKTEPQELSTAPTETAEPLEAELGTECSLKSAKPGVTQAPEEQKSETGMGMGRRIRVHVQRKDALHFASLSQLRRECSLWKADKELQKMQIRVNGLSSAEARWLATGLTTENVLERLVTCEEFGLGLLREKINERILQDLLVQVASLQDKPPKEEVQAEETDKKEVEAEKDDENQDAENKENKHENRQEKPEKQSKKEKQDKHKPTKAEKLAKQEKPQEKPPAKRKKAGA
eukprot:Skav220012  [mRNA]  locus=scaffold947:289590:294534:+ [translate_table: standard]